MRLNRIIIYGTLPVLLASCAGQASAHRDDYLNETVVYLTLARTEIEAEYWFDVGQHSGIHNHFIRHNIATEWGFTDKWMADGRVTLLSEQNKNLDFASWRIESRYRFGDENTLPIDVAVSLEANSERESDGSSTQGIEPRLILSKDVGEKLNFTGNFSEEIPLDGQPTAFLVAFGNRFNWTQLVRIGYELQYNYGTHSGSAVPQVWFALKHDITFKLGYSARFDQETDNFARAALEIEF
jgi:hypothetical protein